MAFFLVLGIFFAVASALSVSRQIQLGDHEYFVPPTVSWKLESWDYKAAEEFVPLTVVHLNDTVNAASVASVLVEYGKDDVWTASFTKIICVKCTKTTNDWVKDLPPEYNTSAVFYSDNAPPGPYFVHTTTGNVYQAYRLYADTNQAFIQASYQDPSGTHHPLRAASFSAGGLSIAVPSRLYLTPTPEKPLAGVRISVKDLYDLRGLKTSGGNRALYEISDIKKETAFAVQRLIDAGAVVIGKNKMSEFAFAGMYVTEHIDYLLPFNPRGDGYNSPSDSSGGSAAAAASYDWLDATMGSDTGGSIRGPAAVNGVHGNRPTWGAVDLTGALPLSTAMDTSGILARDPLLWSKINRVLYSETKEYHNYPKTIYLDPQSKATISNLQDYFVEVADVAQHFLDALTKLLSAEVKTFSLDKAWDKSGSDPDNSLSDVTSFVYRNLTRYEQWTKFGKDYVKKYKASHNGEFPHMVPHIRSGWLMANKTITEETHRQDLESKKMVEDWAAKHFLSPDKDACSNAVYIYFWTPLANYKPDVSKDTSNPYISHLADIISNQQAAILELNKTINCNTTLGTPEACKLSLEALVDNDDDSDDSVSPGRLASVAGLPDYAITLGSFDLGGVNFSNSTLKNQSLPLAVDIMAAKGCDFVILDIVEALYKEGVIRTVKTGQIV
ncbi:hypothetical protein CEP54_004627 [Fusarium duplospermum]|uniref:Amidase domain-containing protein n=1 Tax=Fusarium duplospermum TaxID=1325734 RepID=A0A428QHS4_9HYPO|nr:hypothetical protein CEP54_004627 [Fusarium duplospermum]